MVKILKFPDRGRIDEEAAAWLARLDSGAPLSADEALAFKSWLSARPEHKRAVLDMALLWDDMALLTCLRDFVPLEQFTVRSRGRSAWWGQTAGVALVAALSMVAVTLYLRLAGIPDPVEEVPTYAATYHTRVGEQSHIELPDGSMVILNTDSDLDVNFNAERRWLQLHRGEAHFQVAHDEVHPFIVRAAAGTVRAVGTAFSIRLRGDEAEVLVTEGTVEVQPGNDLSEATAQPDLETPGSTFASAGQSVGYSVGSDVASPVLELAPQLLEKKISWREGVLTFNGDPLDEVVRELSRYTDTEIVISDPDIRRLSVGGRYQVGETEKLLLSLQDSLGIRVNRINDRLVYLEGNTPER